MNDTNDYLHITGIIQKEISGLPKTEKEKYLAEYAIEFSKLNIYSNLLDVYDTPIKYDSLLYVNKTSRTVKDRIDRWLRDQLNNLKDDFVNYPVYDLLRWTHKASLQDHLQRLKDNRIIDFTDMTAILEMTEKVRVNNLNKTAGDYAKSIFAYWKENNFINFKAKASGQFIKGYADAWSKFFYGFENKKKKFSDYASDNLADIKKIIEN
jgi:hypothetical protein